MTSLPRGDVHLADGRRLRYKGKALAIPGRERTLRASGNWKHPAGLHVVASIDEYQEGVFSRHVSVSYTHKAEPSDADVNLVRDAFFPEAEALFRVSGGVYGPVIHLTDDRMVAGILSNEKGAIAAIIRRVVTGPEGTT